MVTTKEKIELQFCIGLTFYFELVNFMKEKPDGGYSQNLSPFQTNQDLGPRVE